MALTFAQPDQVVHRRFREAWLRYSAEDVPRQRVEERPVCVRPTSAAGVRFGTDKRTDNMQLKKLEAKSKSISWPKDSNDLPIINWDEYQRQHKTSGRKLIAIGGFIHDASSFIECVLPALFFR